MENKYIEAMKLLKEGCSSCVTASNFCPICNCICRDAVCPFKESRGVPPYNWAIPKVWSDEEKALAKTFLDVGGVFIKKSSDEEDPAFGGCVRIYDSEKDTIGVFSIGNSFENIEHDKFINLKDIVNGIHR